MNDELEDKYRSVIAHIAQCEVRLDLILTQIEEIGEMVPSILSSRIDTMISDPKLNINICLNYLHAVRNAILMERDLLKTREENLSENPEKENDFC